MVIAYKNSYRDQLMQVLAVQNLSHKVQYNRTVAKACTRDAVKHQRGNVV